MDTLTAAVTLTIRMTGLLLISNANARDSLPAYVLIPKTHVLSEMHTAQVGYRTSPLLCQTGLDHNGVCWESLADWSLELGTVAQGKTVLPHAKANLSVNTGLRVRTNLLRSGVDPSGLLASRVILNSGEVSDECAMAQWSIQNDTQRVHMPNVLVWRMPNVTELRMRSLTGSAEKTIPLPADGELFIRHVPDAEIRGYLSVISLHEPAIHYSAIYDLFEGNGTRRLPYYRGLNGGHRCQEVWTLPPTPRMKRFRPNFSPTTVNCMIAYGQPS